MDPIWIKEWLAKIDDRMDKQAETLARLTTSVEHHVKRTDLLEAELAPIKTHVAAFTGVAKSIFILGAVLGILKTLGLF
jgi:uncharacterized protein YcaQ